MAPLVRRIPGFIAFVVATLVLAALLSATGLYIATRRAPAFYADAVALDPQEARRGSDELLENATALANSVKREGKWYALLSEQQINGWLAVDLVENHADLLPVGVVDPRVEVRAGRATIACSYNYPGLSAVLSVAFEVYLVEPRVVALRIHSTRAGALPVPMTPIVEGVARAAEQLNLRVEWRQMHGDPVALITLPSAHTESMIYRLEALQLRDGAVYLMGCTEDLRDTPRQAGEAAAQSEVALRP